jgi:hypothetical protein
MAVTWKKIAYEDNVITKATFTTKGDMLVTTGASTPTRLAVGTDGQVIVADAASAPGVKWQTGPTPGAHATTHKRGGSDELDLDELGVPDGAVDFNLQQATDLVVMTVANEAALPSSGVAVGQLCFATSELSLHICTVAA